MREFDFYGAPLQPDFRVNTIIAGQQFRSSVAALADGGFVIVWVDASQSLGPGTFSEIRGQRYDQFGVAVGGEFLINEIVTTNVGQPFVTGLPGGGFVVAWADGTNGLRVREFAADGIAIAGEVGIRGVPVGTPTIAINANGDRMITWLEQVPATQTEAAHIDVRGMILRADGTSVAMFDLGSTNEGAQGTPRVVALIDGTFMAVWHDARLVNGQNLGLEVRAQRFDSNGNRLGDEFTVNSSSLGDQVNPHLVALPSGGFAVTWLNAVNGAGPPATVRVQQFDAAGNRVGPESDLAVAANGSTYQPFIVALADGRVAVSFGYSINNVAQSVLAQQFDRHGMPLGETFELTGTPPPSRTEGNAAVLASGRIVVAWTDFGLEGVGGSGSGIRARILDPLTYVQGDEGENIINVGSGGAIVEAFGGNDRINGGDGDDKLAGGAGDDVIHGGGGRDEIYGGNGDDTLDGGAGDDFLYGGDGDDHLTSSGGSGFQEFLSGGAGNDVIRAANGSFLLAGDDGDDIITLTGGTGSSTVWGGSGNDVVNVSGTGTIFVGGEAGDDDITISGFSSGTIAGHEGNDVIRLPAGNFTVILGKGQDRIIPTVGPGFITLPDFAAGEAGDQIDFSVYGPDPFAPGGALTITQGGGMTVVDHAASGTRYVFHGVLVENLSAFNLGVPNPLYAPRGVILDGEFAEHPHIAYADELVGADGDDTIRGHAGNDTLFGAGGNDLLDGGTGADRLVGGTGNDVYIVDDVADQVVELSAQGADEVRTTLADYTLPDHVENLLYVGTAQAHLAGNSGANLIIGGAGQDTLRGHGGADLLDGGAGADQMYGGLGDDVFIVDNEGDQVFELAGEGTDEIRTSLTSYVLPANVERLTYTGTGNFQAIGGDGNDFIRGGAGHDNLRGNGGNDLLDLSAGGADAAFGGDGDDGFYFGGAMDGVDLVDGGTGNDQLALQGVYGGLTFNALGLTNVEMVVLMTGRDTRFANLGGALTSYNLTTVDANVAAGQVLMFQANTLRAGENFTLNAAAETDGSILTFGGVGTETITGGQGDDGFYFGTGRFNAGDRVDGQGGSDQLGLQGDYAGANALTLGANQLVGIEFIVLMSGADARYSATAGQSFSYTLATHDANVAAGQQMVIQANMLRVGEVLRFNGATETDGSFRVFGGASADLIIGGAQADDLSGGAGGDRIEGGGGADVIRAGAGADIFGYRAISDSTAGARDRIMDFAQGDLIDLSNLDGNASAAGVQEFQLIGSGSAFTAAGQLRITQNGTVALVEGDSNGDGVADFAIEVTMTGGHTLTRADFLGLAPAAEALKLEEPELEGIWLQPALPDRLHELHAAPSIDLVL